MKRLSAIDRREPRGSAGRRTRVAAIAPEHLHEVIGLTRKAAREYAAAGIRVNAVCPGRVRTPRIRDRLADPELEAEAAASAPLGRLGTPEEVAAAVVWLCSEASSLVTGTCLVVDGGMLA